MQKDQQTNDDTNRYSKRRQPDNTNKQINNFKSRKT